MGIAVSGFGQPGNHRYRVFRAPEFGRLPHRRGMRVAIRIRDVWEYRRRPETAFVLGGGGNLGAIQVGQLRALLERGIVPDVVVGCSVGALNAAAVAGNPSPDEVDRLVGLWSTLTRDDIFPSSKLTRGPWLFVRNGLSAFPNAGLRHVIDG